MEPVDCSTSVTKPLELSEVEESIEISDQDSLKTEQKVVLVQNECKTIDLPIVT